MEQKPIAAKGTLYLIPTPLGEVPPALVMPAEVLQRIPLLRHIIVEQLRTARRLLKAIDPGIDVNEIQFNELNKHTDLSLIRSFLQPAFDGNDIGLMSEAGSPCVADPGALVVEQAHSMGIKVQPLSGPSAIIQALMASGFNGQSFVFHGYLPIAAEERTKMIRQMEKDSSARNQTQIFIETPFRNQQMLEALLKSCRAERRLCVSSNISMPDEWIASGSIASWQKKRPNFHKKPTVFLLWAADKS